jgi:hypothetical protein
VNIVDLRTRQAETSSVGASHGEHDSFRGVPVRVSSGRATCAPALDGKNFGEGPDTCDRDYDDPNDRLTSEF